MKLINLAEKILKYIVKEYKSTGNTSFNFPTIKSEFPKYSDDELSNAIYLLKNDGFVSVFPGDNVAYTTMLLPDGIRNCEENTFLVKGYSLMKEIKSLLS